MTNHFTTTYANIVFMLVPGVGFIERFLEVGEKKQIVM